MLGQTTSRTLTKYLGFRISTLGGLGLAVMLSAGCAGQGDGDADLATEGSLRQEKVLASVDVGYGKVTFHEIRLEDGSTVIGASEETPASYRNTPYQRLASEGHTSLEMWKALLPGAEAPESLIQAHPIEAAELKRPTDEVIAGVFDKNAQIEQSSSSCRTLANNYVWKPVASDSCYDYAWVNKRASVAQTGSHWFGVIDNSGATTTANVTMGICNDSNVNITGRPVVKKADSSSYVPIWSSPATVQPGHIWYWYNFSRTSLSTCSGTPPGQICLELPLPSAYRIEGSSPSGKEYYLYTGVLQSTLKSICEPR
jgi:hypothetical protein